jgi:hypothetical protein
MWLRSPVGRRGGPTRLACAEGQWKAQEGCRAVRVRSSRAACSVRGVVRGKPPAVSALFAACLPREAGLLRGKLARARSAEHGAAGRFGVGGLEGAGSLREERPLFTEGSRGACGNTGEPSNGMPEASKPAGRYSRFRYSERHRNPMGDTANRAVERPFAGASWLRCPREGTGRLRISLTPWRASVGSGRAPVA